MVIPKVVVLVAENMQNIEEDIYWSGGMCCFCIFLYGCNNQICAGPKEYLCFPFVFELDSQYL